LTAPDAASYPFRVLYDASRLLTLDLELPSPLAAYAALRELPYPFLLHSSLRDDRARWSFFGADPFVVFRGGDFAAAPESFRRFALPTQAERDPDESPFQGGLVGYWSYDFGRRLERLPSFAVDDLGLPDFVLGGYDVIGAFDHATVRARLYSSGLPHEGARGAGRARARLDAFAKRLAKAREPEIQARGNVEHRAHSTFTPDDYRRSVDQIREHIRRGDIFQANLSQRWTVAASRRDLTDLALPLTVSIARHTPSPFAATFECRDHVIVSASPERFLELRNRRIETRPIKGTRPRGSDPASDAALAAELLASAKDRAENVMIVDVLRNDLGRVCETGTVETRELCALESFAQVHHLTSTVTGTLRRGLDAFDLLRAAFPGGSITGAPKIRAMEVLEAIEPVRRHIYTGALGYLDWNGDADWNIAIRTALLTGDSIRFAAGGGITADSDPDAELEETLHKAEGLRSALSAVLGPVELVADGVAAR
jgi:para-aminobenzoate synthetase component I